MDINLINRYLEEGKTVKEIRNILGYSEKSYQNKIKELGYKYNQKIKQYVLKDIDVIEITSNNTSNTSSNTICNTNNISLFNKDQEQSINFINENIKELQEIIMYYKRNKECSTRNKSIVIDLIDDKEIDNGKPVSVRVNKHIWRAWKEFTKDSGYNSKDLVSMALKEYMNKYK